MKAYAQTVVLEEGGPGLNEKSKKQEGGGRG